MTLDTENSTDDRFGGRVNDAVDCPVPGALWASEIDAAPEDSIFVTYEDQPEVWQAVRKYRDRYGLDINRDTTFEELDAVPGWVLDPAGLEFSREQVTEFVNEYAYPITDPIEAMAELEASARAHKAERIERFRQDNRAKQSLRERGVAAGAQFTLAEIDRVCGDQPYVVAARELIDRANAEAWALRRRDDERLPIVTAAELFRTGAPVEDIAKLTPATASARIDAAMELAVAHDKFRAGVSRLARTTGTGAAALDAATMTAEEVENQVPPTPLIEGFLFEKTLAQVYGEYGSFKSFVTYGMACSLATGIPFGGEYAVAGGGVPVLYIAAEGSAGYMLRQSAWRAHHKVSRQKLDDNLTFVSRPAQLASEEDVAWLHAKVVETGAKLVVIDTQARSTVGMDENSATDQGPLINAVETIIAETGTTVLMVHHTAKGGDTGRGSNAWGGAGYSLLWVRRKGREMVATVTCVKHKDQEDGCNHEFGALVVDAPSDPGKTSLVMSAVDAAEVAENERKAISEKHVEVLTVIRDLTARTPAGVSQTAIASEAYNRELYSKPRASQCNTVVALLLNQGYAVDKSRGGTSAKKIVLADTPPQGGWPDGFDPKPALLVGPPAELDPARPEHEAAVRRVLDTLGALRTDGSVHAKTTQRTFIDTYAPGVHEQIVATAWERWVNEGRPDTTGISACYVEK